MTIESQIADLDAKLDALRQDLRSISTRLGDLPEQPEWVSVAKAAQLAQREKRTIRNWISAGKVQARGSGHDREVNRASLMARVG